VNAARRILVCDDEPQILRALKVVLREAGFEAIAAETGEEALDRAAVRPPDAAIVDLVLPDIDGIEVCRRLREWSDMPILVLSAGRRGGGEGARAGGRRRRLRDQAVRGARARRARAGRAAPRRRRPDEPAIRVDGLEVDLSARTVRVEGSEIHLTPIEFDLLRTLARNRGRLMTHRSLLVEVWGPQYASDTQILRTHIANLRRKIEPAGEGPRYIRTDPGVGYRLAT
jgi:two-component system KDP operon response regulator KdpE